MTQNTDRSSVVWQIDIADEQELIALAHEISAFVQIGDFVALTGDLGVGKTTFARALICEFFNDSKIEVPSPTFTLMQIYEAGRQRLVHADFYRVNSLSDLMGLGWEETVEEALALVEWAERIPQALPKDRLEIVLDFGPADNPNERRVTIIAYGDFAARLAPFKAIRDLLRQSGWAKAHRSFLQGDASSRAYETLENKDGARAILMISPQRSDGPPLRYGKSYSQIARLAENVTPFVAIGQGLRERGFSAPEIYASDLENGILLIEDLGRTGIVDDAGPILARYLAAAAVLASLHAQLVPGALKVEEGRYYSIPPYDLDALLIEVELLLDWYVDHVNVSVASGARANFINLWRQVLMDITHAPPTWTLRDYHSPNLIWLEGREGLERIGIIDFQDCVLGNPAYDLASLGQDARVTIADAFELKVLAHYANLRREKDPHFNMPEFARSYSIMAAQRNTKILGIFARLNRRDGKPHYLAHLPRIEAYLKKSLRHPALEEIKAWYKTNIPILFSNE
jgi:N-acetylmuramate 1-kinase